MLALSSAGSDAPPPAMNLPNDRRTRMAMAVASHLALLLVWYLFVKFGDVPKFVMPSPVDTAKTLGSANYQWWRSSKRRCASTRRASPPTRR